MRNLDISAEQTRLYKSQDLLLIPEGSQHLNNYKSQNVLPSTRYVDAMYHVPYKLWIKANASQ